MFTHRYNDHTESTYLKKSSPKKLILDTCTKTAFSLYNVVYEIRWYNAWVLHLILAKKDTF